ncbi:MAG: hypothetical protein ACTSXP_03050, partial [Promethearchaeota archaeon]
MSDEIVKLVEELMDLQENIYGVAVMNSNDKKIIYQTENWDVTPDVNNFLNAWENNESSVLISNVKYMIVENTPERLVGTNVTG